MEAAGSLAEAKALLADVEMCWDAILQREYAQIPLENFLLDDASQEFTDFCARLEERSECCMKPSRPFAVEAMDRHWVALHKRVFEQHQVAELHRKSREI